VRHSTKLIIGVHGLKNKPEPEILRGWWTAAVAEGISRNCQGQMVHVDLVLAYWADVMYSAPVVLGEEAEPYIAAKGTGPLPKGVSIKRIAEARIREGVGKALELVFGTPVTEDVVDDALKTRAPDLYRYEHDRAARDAVQERLTKELRSAHATGRQIMLIAHSMGSIVAYDVLAGASRALPGLRISHFVTVGSPLGLSAVKKVLAAPLRVPECVERWSNLADPRDHVARWDTRLSSDFRENSAGSAISDHLVINGYASPSGKPNPHKIYGYLRTPEMSELIARFAATLL
jgi:pimeloyl-ACP methyl ester carboxylesterase